MEREELANKAEILSSTISTTLENFDIDMGEATPILFVAVVDIISKMDNGETDIANLQRFADMLNKIINAIKEYENKQ